MVYYVIFSEQFSRIENIPESAVRGVTSFPYNAATLARKIMEDDKSCLVKEVSVLCFPENYIIPLDIFERDELKNLCVRFRIYRVGGHINEEFFGEFKETAVI